MVKTIIIEKKEENNWRIEKDVKIIWKKEYRIEDIR